MKKLFSPILVAFAAVMMTASAYAIDLGTSCPQIITAPGDYEMTGDIDCSTGPAPWEPTCSGTGNHVYGIIVQADGVSINGQGYKITGPGEGNMCCQVVLDEEGQCAGHPCRLSFAGQDGNAWLDSGVLSAGNDNLTIKDIEITGFCNGINVQGSCDGIGTNTGYVTQLVIEDNLIHDNGQSCDMTLPAPPFDPGGEPSKYNFNDGIYTAYMGVPSPAPGNQTTTWCTDADKAQISIANNSVWNQKGCGIESCPGGNAINLQGGELSADYSGNDTTWYGGCAQVHNNKVQHAGTSGIMLSHALQFVDIYKNIVTNNGFGGITIPCDFSDKNNIFHNAVFENYGPGIGLNCPQNLDGNLVKNAMASFYNVGWPASGDGLLMIAGNPFTEDEPGEGYVLVGNVFCGNAALDIRELPNYCTGDPVVVASALDNQCDNATNAAMCDFPCPASCPACKGDIDGDGDVDNNDSLILKGEFNNSNTDCSSPWIFE